jgi:ABC-type uncharacterized transport system substrate-binding protein
MKKRVPVMSFVAEYAEAGGLIACSPNLLDVDRRAATYIDRILKGAKPADLPVEQPTKLELVIHSEPRRRSIGVTIPSLLQRGDRIIN